jgi:hypothetical protein
VFSRTRPERVPAQPATWFRSRELKFESMLRSHSFPSNHLYPLFNGKTAGDAKYWGFESVSVLLDERCRVA